MRGPNGQPLVQSPEPEPPPDARYEGRIRPRLQVTSAGDPPPWRRSRVTIGNDGHAGPPVSSRLRTKPGPRSPEPGLPYPVLENPAAQLATQSTAQRALRQRLIREQVKRAEDHAQAAYDQSRAALELISRSMESVLRAFAEAKHARDRYYDLLTVSSRFRATVRHRASANASSAHPRRHDIPTLPPAPRLSTPPPVVRAVLKPAIRTSAKLMTSPPTGPRHAAGENSSSPDWYKRSSSSHPFSCKVPLHVLRTQAPVTVPWDPGGHPGRSIRFSASAFPAPGPSQTPRHC